MESLTNREVIEHLGRSYSHFHVEDFQAIRQVVVEPSGRDGDEKPSQGCNEGFADVLENHHHAEPLLPYAAPKSTKETHNRAEETDERGGRGDGCEMGETSLHF